MVVAAENHPAFPGTYFFPFLRYFGIAKSGAASKNLPPKGVWGKPHNSVVLESFYSGKHPNILFDVFVCWF